MNIIKNVSTKRVVELILGGALLTLCFAPFNIIFGLPVSFYLLLKNVFQKPYKQAFYSGIVFGFSHFLTSLYWIGIALMVDIAAFWWLFPFAILLIPAALSVFTGVVCAISSRVRTNKFLFSMFFSSVWVVIEIIRGFFPLPFPWHFVSYTVSNYDYLLQIAPYTSVYITSLIVMLISTSYFTRNKYYISLCVCVVAGITYFGAVVFESQNLKYMDGKFRIVQPNLEVHHMGNSSLQSEAFQTLVSLSLVDQDPDLKAVIWPEASFPYLFRGLKNELIPLSKLAPRNGYLIMGADRMDSEARVYNSIVVISHDAKLMRAYDKHTLVPFGEYIPLKNILSFIDKIAYGMGEFSRGEGQHIVSQADLYLKFYGLICYESIFPIDDPIDDSPFLLNVTNDGWYGNSSGPYQHLAMAKFKSAEYGISMIRVANTGISAVISPYGEVIERIPFGVQGVKDVSVPIKLHTLAHLGFWCQTLAIIIFTSALLCINVYVIKRGKSTDGKAKKD
jgi:apolipoprotein N-acyltransferase